jgi:hypothetical protein
METKASKGQQNFKAWVVVKPTDLNTQMPNMQIQGKYYGVRIT